MMQPKGLREYQAGRSAAARIFWECGATAVIHELNYGLIGASRNYAKGFSDYARKRFGTKEGAK